jgi:hypothetical protein
LGGDGGAGSGRARATGGLSGLAGALFKGCSNTAAAISVAKPEPAAAKASTARSSAAAAAGSGRADGMEELRCTISAGGETSPMATISAAAAPTAMEVSTEAGRGGCANAGVKGCAGFERGRDRGAGTSWGWGDGTGAAAGASATSGVGAGVGAGGSGAAMGGGTLTSIPLLVRGRNGIDSISTARSEKRSDIWKELRRRRTAKAMADGRDANYTVLCHNTKCARLRTHS